jgi:hypothetical protein
MAGITTIASATTKSATTATASIAVTNTAVTVNIGGISTTVTATTTDGCISPVMSKDSEVKQTVRIERTCSVYRQGKSAF